MADAAFELALCSAQNCTENFFTDEGASPQNGYD